MALPEFGSTEFLTQATGQGPLASGLESKSLVVKPTPEPPSIYMPNTPANYTKTVEQQSTELFGSTLPKDFFGIVLRNAQLNMQLKEAHIAEGWANYNKTVQLAELTMKRHERDARDASWEYLPKARAYLDTFLLNSPERKRAEEYTRNIIGGLHPDGLKALDAFIKDPVAHYGANLLLKDNPEAQQLFESMGPAFYDTDFAKRLGAVKGRDMVNSLMSRLSKEQHDKLVNKQMSQDEFVKTLTGAAVDPSIAQPVSPQELQFVKTFLSSPTGEAFMAGLNIPLESAAKKRQETRATWTLDKAFRDEEIQELHAKKVSGIITPVESKRLDIYLGERSKESDVINRPQSPMDRFLIPISKGVAKSFGELANLMQQATAEGDVEKMATYQDWAAKAKKDYRESSPLGRQDVGYGQLQDISKHDIYDRSQLAKGIVQKVIRPVSALDLASGKYIDMDPKSGEEVKSLSVAMSQFTELATISEKLFKATDQAGVLKQQAIAYDVQNIPGASARHDPAWTVYANGLAAWAGRFARILGTERGVMTDLDIERWKNTFPAPGDTAAVVKMKNKIFRNMASYVLNANMQMIAGKLDLSYGDSKENRDTINGFLGSAEQLGKTSGATRKKSAAERLLEEISLEEKK